MEEAMQYIEDLKYPTKLAYVQEKLQKLRLDNQTSTELLERAQDLIIESIRTKYKSEIRTKAENLANRGPNYLFQYGVEDIDQEFIIETKNKFSKYLGNSNFDSDIELTKIYPYYYSKFAKRLLKQTHFEAENLKSVLDKLSHTNCETFKIILENPHINISLEKYDISQNIQSAVPNIRSIYPILQKVLNKMSYDKFIEVLVSYVSVLYNLLNQGFYQNFTPRFVKSVCRILDKYSEQKGYQVYERAIISVCFNISENGNYGFTEWENFSTKERVDAYILFYLILSKEILVLMRIPLENYPDLQNLNIFYMSSSREILKTISKEYKIFVEANDNSGLHLLKGSFNFIKIIETAGSELFSSIRPNIQQLMIQSPNIYLKKLNETNSSHIVILISGYLSEKDDHEQQWQSLISLYPNNSFYSYAWESSTLKDLLVSLLKLSFGIKHFNEIYNKALEAGYHLRSLLINDRIFKGSSITLIGFSLGTVVAHSCLQYLCDSNYQMIHDCILLGSAIDIEAQIYNQAIRANAVSGMFLNVYCTKDLILKKMFKLTAGTRAFGVGTVNGMDNLDVTSIVSSHQKYRKNLERIFKMIKDF